MRLVLYVIPGSHPCETAAAALEVKGLHYERVDLLPGFSQLQQLVRFGRRTVPGLVVDGYKVSGSRLILRTLDGLAPEPPLFPREPDERSPVEEAERWGEEELQDQARLISVYAIGRHPETAGSFLAGANVPSFPPAVQALATGAVFRVELMALAGGADGARRALENLPRMLDRTDELIAAGTIGGERPNAADLQIGASIALLARLEDLRPAIDPRPCGELARRLFPRYPGHVPAGALPAEWLSGLAPDAPRAVASQA